MSQKPKTSEKKHWQVVGHGSQENDLTINADYINAAVMIREVSLMKERISLRFFDADQCDFLINFLGTN